MLLIARERVLRIGEPTTQNRPQPIWVPLPIKAELPAAKRDEIIRKLKEALGRRTPNQRQQGRRPHEEVGSQLRQGGRP